MADNLVDVAAQNVVQNVVNRYGQAAERSLSGTSADDADIDQLVSDLFDLSDGQLDNFASSAVRALMRRARAAEFINALKSRTAMSAKALLQDEPTDEEDQADEDAAAGDVSGGDLPENIVWRRSSVLEPSTCQPCEAADGQEIDGPDDDLSEICDGSDLCRCFPYATFEGEG